MANHIWTEIETKVRNRVMVKVSSRIGERDGATLYSMRVGTPQLLDDGTMRISSHMSIYDIPDALTLLKELSEKYVEARSEERKSRSGIVGRYRTPGQS